MLEVRYEDLVSGFAVQARRLIEYCGVAWDDRCLAFHQTERPVWTASVVQVREPIHTTAVGRWRNYEPWLTPLLEALGEIGDVAPSPA